MDELYFLDRIATNAANGETPWNEEEESAKEDRRQEIERKVKAERKEVLVEHFGDVAGLIEDRLKEVVACDAPKEIDAAQAQGKNIAQVYDGVEHVEFFFANAAAFRCDFDEYTFCWGPYYRHDIGAQKVEVFEKLDDLPACIWPAAVGYCNNCYIRAKMTFVKNYIHGRVLEPLVEK